MDEVVGAKRDISQKGWTGSGAKSATVMLGAQNRFAVFTRWPQTGAKRNQDRSDCQLEGSAPRSSRTASKSKSRASATRANRDAIRQLTRYVSLLFNRSEGRRTATKEQVDIAIASSRSILTNEEQLRMIAGKWTIDVIQGGQSNAAFTLDKYTQTDNDELLAAQNLMLDAIFKTVPQAVQ